MLLMIMMSQLYYTYIVVLLLCTLLDAPTTITSVQPLEWRMACGAQLSSE